MERMRWVWSLVKIKILGAPGWLSREAPAFAQGLIPGSRDQLSKGQRGWAGSNGVIDQAHRNPPDAEVWGGQG